MSSTQIWVFGALAFVLLFILFGTLSAYPGRPTKTSGPGSKEVTEKLNTLQQELAQQRDEMHTGTTAINERLAEIQRILKAVE